jgi:hypothetical protein
VKSASAVLRKCRGVLYCVHIGTAYDLCWCCNRCGCTDEGPVDAMVDVEECRSDVNQQVLDNLVRGLLSAWKRREKKRRDGRYGTGAGCMRFQCANTSTERMSREGASYSTLNNR